jgi:hypothetical protein
MRYLGSGLNCIVEMAGQMAKKCKEVFEGRAKARLKTLTQQFAAICLSPNLVLGCDRVLFTGCCVAKA